MISSVKNYPDVVSEENTTTFTLAPNLADTSMDLISEIQGGYSALGILDGKVHSKASLVLGFTGSLGLLTGPLLVKRAFSEIKISQRLSDILGELIGWARMGTGISQSSAGAIYTAMTTAALIFFITTMQVAIKTAQVLSFVGGGLYTIAGLSSAFTSILELYMIIRCKKIIKNAGDDPEKIVQNILFACVNPKQKSHFQRILGKELLMKILEKDTTISSKQLVLEIHKQIRQNLIRMVLWAILSIIGSSVAILSMVLTGMVAQYTFIAASLLMGILWVGIDIQGFFSSYSNDPMNRSEKFCIIASSIFCFAIIAASFVLCSHPAIMGLILLTAIILAIIHLLSIYKVYTN